MTRGLVRGSLVFGACMVVAGGCGPREQRTETMDAAALREARASLSDDAVAALDSGGAAFRAQEYEVALDLYREAAGLEPEAAAPWFGVYMAQRALGNQAAADSALTRARALAPGATLLVDTLE